MPYANDNDVEQPAQTHSLLNVIPISYADSIANILATAQFWNF